MASTAPENDPRQDEPEVGPPADHAVGIPAIVESMRVTGQQSGMRRGLPTLVDVNQRSGFDCPGCAWPEPDHRHPAEFCENGAKAVAEEATRRAVDPDFFAQHSVSDLAGRSGYWLGQQGRLTQPMLLDRAASHYTPITWDEAFDLLASELRQLPSPDRAVFYTSGRTSNEAAFLYQLFARQFGTNNLPDCSNMCHESSGEALGETLGIGKGSVLLEDIYQADVIIVAGQNPGTNHPRMLTALERAKRSGSRIITVNPLPETGMRRFKNPQTARGIVGRGTRLTDLFLQIRLGGDLGLFQALNRLLLQVDEHDPGAEAVDREFVERYTHGFEDLRAALLESGEEEFWGQVQRATGLERQEIEEALAMLLTSRRIVVCWAMGLTQHQHAVPTIREIVNFLLLRGAIGRPGAGVCPVRGHSNVQGDRTMGIYERPDPAFLDALATEFGFAPPREPGLDTVNAIRAMRDGRVGVFMAMGGNFVSATPDTDTTEAAMRRCGLTVHVSTKLNRSHVVTGARALILPARARSDHDVQDGREQFVTVEDSMGMVHASRGSVPPLSAQMRSEVDIITNLARRVLGPDNPVPWERMRSDYDTIRDRIEGVVPGFTNFNARVREPGGFALPHAPRDSRTFPTATGRAHFTANTLTAPEVPSGHLLLQTLRSHDQYNTTIYGLDDRYRGVHNGRRVVFVNPTDAEELGVADGDYVDLVSAWSDARERRAPHFRVVSYPTARGCAAAYYPETNVLVPLDSTAEASNTPTSKSIVVRLEPDSGDYQPF
ncbi:FdhF/YdeP family oxidoreductase [Lipingzhangella sp. LS1_29]|uniref:FdhF/YdeP family oxidoreductase n=1 Tax=Lipingzhangella rawalii TaxID=2055835 RepID=A0ABU2H3W7_9ACTN|nr:FdhF/YdeP family oxidoreductase [Lipingzhangella rawalii]MDS1269299.1 FdhF/YdeP family oxidoreductase [Lipingzhangella rawalii]